jgi:tetratricopeptide (TPR) repeat protein
LLSESEASLFARLAVFAGGFDLEAAEAVAGADIDTLVSLIDKSLLRQTDAGRFFMLETIREFALERLEASDDRTDVRRRHAKQALTRATWTEETEIGEWHRRVKRDYADFRAALVWLRDRREALLLLRLAARLGRFWEAHNLREGRLWLETALARAPRAATPERAEGFFRLGSIAWRQGEFDLAAASIEAAHEAAVALGDTYLLAWLHVHRGVIARYRSGDFREAQTEYQRALEIFREIGANREVAFATRDLGLFALEQGDKRRARDLFDQSLRLSREIDFKGGESQALAMLGLLALQEGRFERALEYLVNSLQFAREINTAPAAISDSLVSIAAAVGALRDDASACVLLGAADTHTEQVGEIPQPRVKELRDHTLAQAASRIGRKEADRKRSEGAALSLEAAIELALSLSADGRD